MSLTLKQYDAELKKCKSMFLNKTRDYGTSWRVLRPSSLTDQIFIKAARIRSLDEKGEAKVDEPIEDAFQGIVNYGLMALIQLENPLDSLSETEWTYEEAKASYEKFSELVRDLMIRKNHDYGEAWRDMRVSSMNDLILMKLMRIKQIEDNKGETLVSEGLEGNFMDIINYAMFCLIKINN